MIYLITIEKKLNTLLEVAEKLNKNNVTWTVGASLLLYLKRIATEFQDIDILISEDDITVVKEILLSLGELKGKNPNSQYKSKSFMEFTINEVDFDVIAGFVIVNSNKEYYFPLQKEEIKDYITIQGIEIPLHSLEQWENYYKLMNRNEKATLINNYLSK